MLLVVSTSVEPSEEELDLGSCLVCRLSLFGGEVLPLVATAMTTLRSTSA